MKAEKNIRKEELEQSIMEYRFSNPKLSYKYCEELLAWAEEQGNSHAEAFALLYMADTLMSLGDIDKTRSYLAKAIRLQKKYQMEDLLMISYNLQAICYFFDGNEMLAIDYCFQSLHLAEKYHNFSLQGMLYNNIGTVFMGQYDYKDAIYYVEKGYEISQRVVGNKKETLMGEIRKNLNLAVCYSALDQTEKALKLLQHVDQIIPDDFYNYQYCGIEEMRAWILYNLGKKEEAVAICDKLLERPEEMFENMEFFPNSCEMSLLYMTEKQYLKVLYILDKLSAASGDNISRRVQLSAMYVSCYQKLAEQENYEEALADYHENEQKLAKLRKPMIAAALDNRFELEREKAEQSIISKKSVEIERISETDELTGLMNRFGFKKFCHKYLFLAKSEKLIFSLLILDLDSFKQFNDTYGHIAGDFCLCCISAALKESTAGSMISARYGGDEFYAAGVDLSEEKLTGLIERIFNKIKESVQQLPCPVTVSVGVVSTVPERKYSMNDYIHNADHALYLAKARGRNQYTMLHELGS